METCQLFIPYRVATVYDVLANAAGALAGRARLRRAPARDAHAPARGAARARVHLRGLGRRGARCWWSLWLLAQLNPALPFFGAGDIGGGGAEGGGPDLLQWRAVALAICGFGLFISALVKDGRGSLRVTLRPAERRAVAQVHRRLVHAAAAFRRRLGEPGAHRGARRGHRGVRAPAAPAARRAHLPRDRDPARRGAHLEDLRRLQRRWTSCCACSAGPTASSPASPPSRACCTSSGRSRALAYLIALFLRVRRQPVQ